MEAATEMEEEEISSEESSMNQLDPSEEKLMGQAQSRPLLHRR
jgi:hypothetical protein